MQSYSLIHPSILPFNNAPEQLHVPGTSEGTGDTANETEGGAEPTPERRTGSKPVREQQNTHLDADHAVETLACGGAAGTL